MEEILKRRSIRKYKTDPVRDEAIQAILQAGMSAPSAHNQRPWHFVVIDDRDKLDQIMDFHAYSKMLKEAPVAILVCSQLEDLRAEEYWVQDCAAATENMLIEIVHQGLGGVWMGVYPMKGLVSRMGALFNIPEQFTAFSLIGIGYADEEKESHKDLDENRIHYNGW